MALTNSNYDALPQLPNIEGLFQLEEASGNRIDQSANTNTLTDNNTVTSGTGKIGTGASFAEATSEYLSIASGSLTGLNNTTFSISAWINHATGAQDAIVGGDAAGNRSIYVNADGTIGLIKAGVIGVGASTATVNDGSLSHILVTYDTSAWKIFVDGVKASGTNAQALGYGNFWVGRTSGDAYYNGIMDELIHWSVVLSDAEAAEVYAITTQAQYKLPAAGGFSGVNSSLWRF